MLSNHFRQKIAIIQGHVDDPYRVKLKEVDELIERGISFHEDLKAKKAILEQQLDQFNSLRMELAALQTDFTQSQLRGAPFSLEAVSRIESRFAEIRRSCFGLGIYVHLEVPQI
jgi:hypothetical protein